MNKIARIESREDALAAHSAARDRRVRIFQRRLYLCAAAAECLHALVTPLAWVFAACWLGAALLHPLGRTK